METGFCISRAKNLTAGFDILVKRKANVNLILAKPPTYSHWDNYLLPSLQAAYDFSDQRSRIKAVLVCNPNNPLSRCYPRSTLLELMEFCQERGLHLICDEVSALIKLNGTDDKAPDFVSALSLTEPFVPEGAVKVDPSRVHVIWSASKLFGMSGFKVVSSTPFILPSPKSSTNSSLMFLYLYVNVTVLGLHNIPTKPLPPPSHGPNKHPSIIPLNIPPHSLAILVPTPHSPRTHHRTANTLLQHTGVFFAAAEYRLRCAFAWPLFVCTLGEEGGDGRGRGKGLSRIGSEGRCGCEGNAV